MVHYNRTQNPLILKNTHICLLYITQLSIKMSAVDTRLEVIILITQKMILHKLSESLLLLIGFL